MLLYDIIPLYMCTLSDSKHQRPHGRSLKIDYYNFFLVPCIQFEQTVYNVVEGDTADKEVEVCVIICSDIGDREIKVHVFGHENVSHIPSGATIASE